MTASRIQSGRPRSAIAAKGARIVRPATGTPRAEHVIDEHHAQTVELKGDIAAEEPGVAMVGVGFAIVAIERDVKGAERNVESRDLLDREREKLGENRTAANDAKQNEIRWSAVALDDFMSQAPHQA